MKYTDFIKWASANLQTWGLYSPQVVELLAMICAHESLGGKHRRQIGGGPARGIFQMEIVTHDSVWNTQDTIASRAKRFGIVRDSSKMERDDVYALFVARHYLLQDKSPLPVSLKAMADYCKSYWNRGGKSSPEKYYRDLELWKAGKL